MITVFMRNVDSDVLLVIGQFPPKEVGDVIDLVKESECLFQGDECDFLMSGFEWVDGVKMIFVITVSKKG